MEAEETETCCVEWLTQLRLGSTSTSSREPSLSCYSSWSKPQRLVSEFSSPHLVMHWNHIFSVLCSFISEDFNSHEVNASAWMWNVPQSLISEHLVPSCWLCLGSPGAFEVGPCKGKRVVEVGLEFPKQPHWLSLCFLFLHSKEQSPTGSQHHGATAMPSCQSRFYPLHIVSTSLGCFCQLWHHSSK